MTISELNSVPAKDIAPFLKKCCGAEKWVTNMISQRPYSSIENLLSQATNLWDALSNEDWMEAFEHHPQIGDLNSLKEKFPNTSSLAAAEQQGTTQATESVLQQLSDYNAQYFDKFGFIFIICATGKSAAEMLDSLKARLNNPLEEEIQRAAKEQIKITCLRLKKLIQ